MGSKSRIVNNILPIIQQRLKDYNIKTYIEPFCGGLNVIDKVVCNKKIASDNHKYLIAMFQNLDKIQELPDFVTKEHYSEVRDCFNEGEVYFPDWYIGAIGFLASYNGRFFDGGYSGLVNTKAGTVRNYYDEAKRNLIEQIQNLQDIEFRCCDYREYTDYEDCLFYLDPPYKGKKQYGSSKEFNHDEFWNWCRHMSEKNIVLISEHEAPSDFECIWEQPVKRTIDNNKRVNVVERLFEIRE
jgi:DNA adenine methylase